MNREYAEILFDYLPGEQRKMIVHNKVKRNIPGFRKPELAPSNILKGVLKNEDRFWDVFLHSVAKMYDCPIEKYSEEDQLPKRTRDNFLGLLAWRCYNSDNSLESVRNLEEIFRQYKQILLDKTLLQNEENSEKVSSFIHDPEDTGEIDKTITEKVQIKEESVKVNNGDDFMFDGKQYIGYIQETNGYYNFWPVYTIEEGLIKSVDLYEIRDKFPDLGNINLYSTIWDYVNEKCFNGEILIITISQSDLVENRRQDGFFQKTNYKIDFRKLEREGYIRRLSDMQIYPVLHPVSEIDFTKKTVLVEEKNISTKDLCLIEENNVLYGPYHINLYDEDQIQVNLINTKNKNSYVVDSYRPKSGIVEYKEMRFEISGYSYIINCVQLDKEFICEPVDKISDQDLLKTFLHSLTNSKDSEKGKITPDLVDDYVASVFHAVPNELLQSRAQRIKSFLEEQISQEEVQEDIAQFMADLLYKFGDSEYFSKLIERILENKDLARKIQSFDIAIQRLDKLQQEYEDIQMKCEKARDDAEEEAADRKKQIEEFASRTGSEISDLSSRKEVLQKDIENLRNQKEDWKNLIKLEEEKNYLVRRKNELKSECEQIEREREEAKDKGNAVDKEIEERLKLTTANAVDVAFDGRIADKIFQAAATYNRIKQDDSYEKIANCLINNNMSADLSGEELVDYLCSSVKRYRPEYSKNEILNIFICVSQNFLTIFSGEPGTGKTSICNIIAHVLGTSKVCELIPESNGVEVARYVPISIERGWTSKRDFIGYYNPLSQMLEKTNKHLYDGLRLLDVEGEKSRYPYIILLDEANLSPIEYYWADFMNICDSDFQFNKITLGDDIQLKIPSSLRFVATINNDDTTERLSPRLIDRAALIRLPDVRYAKVEDEKLTDTSFVKVIRWEELQKIFHTDSFGEMDLVPSNIYEEICRQFRENMRICISPRVERNIKEYWNVAKNLFDSEEGNDKIIVALDYAVAQKLLPKINGSGDSYLKFLEKLQDICEKNNLVKCEKHLRDIIKRGKASMNYYQYF